MTGWIAISRDIFRHEFFAREPMSEREAWVWMLARAAWKDTRHRIGNDMVDVPRGSFFCTLRELQSAWGWASDKRVRTFLKRTQAERMADATNAHGKTHVTICNYDEYQAFGRSEDASGAQEQPQNGRLKETTNKKQENNNTSLPVAAIKDHFADFWDAYPHRQGKKTKRPDAEKAFIKAIRGGATPQQIADGVKALKRDPDTARGYQRGPVPWLNQEGWNDEIPDQLQQPMSTAINGGNYDPRNSSNNPARLSQGRQNGPDPALANIARLAGLS